MINKVDWNRTEAAALQQTSQCLAQTEMINKVDWNRKELRYQKEKENSIKPGLR